MKTTQEIFEANQTNEAALHDAYRVGARTIALKLIEFLGSATKTHDAQIADLGYANDELFALAGFLGLVDDDWAYRLGLSQAKGEEPPAE